MGVDGQRRPNEQARPLFMISVAAELAEMHPQTLRMYERKGLIQPHRSARHTRLYSMEDVERLRYIQHLTCELGLNLAGVERVLELEGHLKALEVHVRNLQEELSDLTKRAIEEAERVHRSYRRELVKLPTTREMVLHPLNRRRTF